MGEMKMGDGGLELVHIERGYEGIVDKLRGVGANIVREEMPDIDVFPQAL